MAAKQYNGLPENRHEHTTYLLMKWAVLGEATGPCQVHAYETPYALGEALHDMAVEDLHNNEDRVTRYSIQEMAHGHINDGWVALCTIPYKARHAAGSHDYATPELVQDAIALVDAALAAYYAWLGTGVKAGQYNGEHNTGRYAGEKHDMDVMQDKIAYAVGIKRTLEDCYYIPELRAISLLNHERSAVGEGQRNGTLPSEVAAYIVKMNY